MPGWQYHVDVIPIRDGTEILSTWLTSVGVNGWEVVSLVPHEIRDENLKSSDSAIHPARRHHEESVLVVLKRPLP